MLHKAGSVVWVKRKKLLTDNEPSVNELHADSTGYEGSGMYFSRQRKYANGLSVIGKLNNRHFIYLSLKINNVSCYTLHDLLLRSF